MIEFDDMTITLAVAKREKTVKNDVLRASGNVPGNVYGPKQTPVSIVVEAKALLKMLEDVGESTIVELTGLDGKIEVLVKDVAFDPVKRAVRHVDFYAIERGKDMTLNVALEFVGVAPAEKDGIGIVTKVLHEVEVTCRPSNLPSHIDVDISSLINDESKITIADLIVPPGVVIENDKDETVAVVSVAEEEEESTPGAIDMNAIAVETKGKVAEEGAK